MTGPLLGGPLAGRSGSAPSEIIAVVVVVVAVAVAVAVAVVVVVVVVVAFLALRPGRGGVVPLCLAFVPFVPCLVLFALFVALGLSADPLPNVISLARSRLVSMVSWHAPTK